MLLHCHREIGAAFYRGIVGDDHAFAPGDMPDAGDEACRWHLAAIEAVRGELTNLEESRDGTNQRADAIARQQLAARQIALPRRLPAADPHLLGSFSNIP